MRALAKRGGSPLPQSYETARTAIAACARVDECAEWADKAAAARVYAKQVKDRAMELNATRIRLRAFKRLGEILGKQPAKAGGRGRAKSQGVRVAAHLEKSERDRAAKEADLSNHEKHTALRIAAVPDADFESAVESPEPPTVTEMADLGTKKLEKAVLDNLDGRDPKAWTRSLHQRCRIRDLAKNCAEFPVDAFVDGCTPKDYSTLKENIRNLQKYLTDVLERLGES